MTKILLNQQYLRTLVPINALTLDHLEALLRDTGVEIVFKGSTIFKTGDYDSQHVYLLSGSVAINSGGQNLGTIPADRPECRFPLLHCQPRRETVVADQDCQIIRFNSDRLDAMLAWDQACSYIALTISSDRDLDEDSDWMNMLLKSNLFYKVPPMNIGAVLNKFEPCYYDAGEIIIRQGEIGDCCYIIKEGAVKILRSEDDKTAPKMIAQLTVGQCFGEDALVNDALRNATVVMDSNGVLMRLSKQDFHVLLKMPPVTRKSIDDAKVIESLCWLDVRTQDEYEQGHIQGSINMPLNILALKSRLLDPQKTYITYCNSGRRSDAAAFFMSEKGMNVFSLNGGFE